jgi:hypothetical protein
MERDGVGRLDVSRASRNMRTRGAEPCLSPFVFEKACENVKQRLQLSLSVLQVWAPGSERRSGRPRP